MDFCKNVLLASFSGISGFMGMTFRKISGSMGILSGNFCGFMGGTFTIRMAQPRIL